MSFRFTGRLNLRFGPRATLVPGIVAIGALTVLSRPTRPAPRRGAITAEPPGQDDDHRNHGFCFWRLSHKPPTTS